MQRTGLIQIEKHNASVSVYGKFGKFSNFKTFYLVSTAPLKNVTFYHTNDNGATAHKMHQAARSENFVYVFHDVDKSIDVTEKSMCDCRFEMPQHKDACGFVEGVMIFEKIEFDEDGEALAAANAQIKKLVEKINSTCITLKTDLPLL